MVGCAQLSHLFPAISGGCFSTYVIALVVVVVVVVVAVAVAWVMSGHK